MVNLINKFKLDIELPRKNRRLFAFPAVTGLLAFVVSILRLDAVWILTSLIYLGLLYGTTSMNMDDNIQRDLYKWTPFLLFFGGSGISSFLQGKFVFGDLAFIFLAPVLGYMLILNLYCYTEFQTNLPFSTSFIFLFTLTAGAVLGTGQFISDRYLGTEILGTNTVLMMKLLVFTIVGLIGSYTFRTYRKRYYHKWEDFSILNQLRSSLELRSKNPKEDLLKTFYSFFGREENDRLLLVSKFLQVCLFLLVIYNIFMLNTRVVGLAIPSFSASIIPYLYSRNLERKVPASFQFWVSISLFAYVAGETAEFQQIFTWWNNFTHFLGGMIVGILIFISLFYLNQISDNLYIPDWMMPLVALMFILSISVLWELFEFSTDTLFSTTLQGGLEDSGSDFIANTLGTLFVLVLTGWVTSFKVFQPLRRKIRQLYS